jgi:hypothetical protein
MWRLMPFPLCVSLPRSLSHPEPRATSPGRPPDCRCPALKHSVLSGLLRLGGGIAGSAHEDRAGDRDKLLTNRSFAHAGIVTDGSIDTGVTFQVGHLPTCATAQSAIDAAPVSFGRYQHSRTNLVVRQIMTERPQDLQILLLNDVERFPRPSNTDTGFDDPTIGFRICFAEPRDGVMRAHQLMRRRQQHRQLRNGIDPEPLTPPDRAPKDIISPFASSHIPSRYADFTYPFILSGNTISRTASIHGRIRNYNSYAWKEVREEKRCPKGGKVATGDAVLSRTSHSWSCLAAAPSGHHKDTAP